MAIGASAGGLSALSVLINALPADFAAAVLVVQHLERTRHSMLPQILGRHARIPVHAAVDSEPIVRGNVYVAVPDAHLLAAGERIALTGSSPVHFSRPSVDALLESVAASYGPRAIGIILTGSGTDGATGMRAIKQRGGVTIVQDLDEADHASMPASAYATGCVDLVLPLHDIAPAIVALVRRTPLTEDHLA